MRVDTNNKVFKSKAYLKDKLKFYVLEQNLASPNLELYSDGESYLLCRGDKKYPTWVWSLDTLSLEQLDSLKKELVLFLTDEDKDRFTCKKSLYALLANSFPYLNSEDYFKMGVLTCEALKEVDTSLGYLDKMKPSEVELLTQYWYLDNLEMQQDMPLEKFNLDKDKLREEVLSWLVRDTFYVLRDNNGNVLSMVMYKPLSDMAKLTHVYTPKDYRCKGYAKTVVYLLSKMLLKKGYRLVLYTDFNNPKSNKAYLNAGFKEEEYLVNFTCSKKKVLNGR